MVMPRPLDKPPSGQTFDWRVFKDWFFRLWKYVTGGVFGTGTGADSGYGSTIALASALLGSDGSSSNNAQGGQYLGPAIVMCAYSTSTQSFPTSGAYSTITTWTVQIDTASALATSTGIYTVPLGGIYQVSYNILWNNVTYLSQGYAEISITHNGTQVFNDLQQVGTATASLYIDITGSYLVKCNAGDTIALQGAQDSGAANTLYANPGSLYNQFMIHKVG
jgi:hypothetical protein